MKEILSQLENQLRKAEKEILEMNIEILNDKISEEKWSKKEILGHLIDSAINNLQRFTEIQFKPKPYRIRKYDQDELVKVNHYQKNEIEALIELWISVNTQIIFVLNNITPTFLNYNVELDQKNFKTLEWLVKDYLDHMEYHLKQIID